MRVEQNFCSLDDWTGIVCYRILILYMFPIFYYYNSDARWKIFFQTDNLLKQRLVSEPYPHNVYDNVNFLLLR